MECFKPDQTDLDIMKLLQVDGKMPYKELADKVGKSINPITERIKRLKAEGYLGRYRVFLLYLRSKGVLPIHFYNCCCDQDTYLGVAFLLNLPPYPYIRLLFTVISRPMQSKNDHISELTELNDELENYFSNTIIPQLFVDAQLVLRKFTPPAMKQFNLKYEFIGIPLEIIKENFRFPTIIDNIQVVIATGKILEKEIQTTDLRWYQMNILPYRIRKENRTNGVIITFVDITSRIRDLKEQERLIAEHELLLDTIAHDIKNPIMGLGLTIEMLKRLPEKSMEKFPILLENIETSLSDMKKVISELVDSRWKEQRMQAVEELLDLGNILEDVRLTLAHQILESGAIIRHDIGCAEITFVRRKLRSMIYNLLSNAIKYTPAERNPDIMIRTYEQEVYIVISITDNGIGMSREEQASIFDKFQRVRMNCEGSGVGLYLVNTIVTGAGGKIELESEKGSGSVFKIFLHRGRTRQS